MVRQLLLTPNSLCNFALFLSILVQSATFNKNNSAPIQKKPAREANFTQRDYDYDSLEKQLLGWDIE